LLPVLQIFEYFIEKNKKEVAKFILIYYVASFIINAG